MWPKIDSLDYECYCSEPIELRNLKHKLASLSCKCHSCLKNIKYKSSTTLLLRSQKDQQVQAKESQKRLFHQCTQVNPQGITNAHDVFMNTITKDVLCPSCFVTMTLLRGGMLRVLKDVEVETNRQTFTSESTESNVKFTNKSTSFLKDARQCSTLTMCDLLTEASSDEVFNMYCHDKPHQVKFLDSGISEQDLQKLDQCLCVDKFIDSIRPPLADYLFDRQ